LDGGGTTIRLEKPPVFLWWHRFFRNGQIGGLTPVSRGWVRVAAKGSHNTGGWSDPALVTML